MHRFVRVMPAGALALTASVTTDPYMGSGISRELATRRAHELSDVRYAMNLSLVGRDTASGIIAIRFDARTASDVILDFRGPSLSNVQVNGATAATTFNGAHLRIPAAAIHAGMNVVTANFKSMIAPAGASIIRFHDDKDGNDYLYTLLVPSDANALFPCFDQPDLKARLTLSLVIPKKWNALANGITKAPGDTLFVSDGGQAVDVRDWKVMRFRETDPLPTYLFAFAAGPWHEFKGGPRNTSLWVRESRAREVEVDSLQDQVGSALNSLEKYFGVKYPFQQFQYLLAPAFPFGGMEHPGVTMFNEDSFIFREPPTLNQRLGRRATIYHEVAHHWFGDDMTMRWFDDLWLKEGFATYMAAKMQDIEGLPNPWMSFYLRNKPAAYDVDQTAGTTPVWQQLANLDQAKSNYGAIVYNKAPGILKQLNYLVGDSAFRAGLHSFLIAHAYGNATWRDLLASIGQAAHRDLTEWGRDYILRPGMPVLEQKIDVANGRVTRLLLVQHPAQALSGRGAWPIRTEVELWTAGQQPTLIPVEIRAETTVVAAAAGKPAPSFVFANANDNAYGLVMLDRESTEWLSAHIGEVHDTFLRAMLWGALWDLVRDARLAPEQFIETAIRELPTEPDEQVSAGIVGRLTRATSTYLSAAQLQSVAPRVEQLLLAGASDARKSYGVRKSQLDAYISIARTPQAIARLNAWLDSASTAGLPLRQPTRWSIVTHLVERGAPNTDALLANEARHDTTTGRLRSAFVAAAGRPTSATKAEYFDRYFRDTTLNEDWATGSLRAFNAPDQSALSLPYLVPALDSLPWIQRNRRIFYLGSWLGGFIGGQRSPEALRDIDTFLTSHKSLPLDLRQKILQTRDDLERTVRIRARFASSAGEASRAVKRE
ncbi:MAG TPA: M1 family aminopeptidase [Gemmatimonadaceae bacterium]|nr:M1 family aminopeptidase [Gemmatimonadaceae bacterium]